MSSTFSFVCHPYHRGGVTSWMAEAFKELQRTEVPSYFVTVDPVKLFYGNGRPTMADIIRGKEGDKFLISKKAGVEFELGTIEYRAYVFCKLITANIPAGSVLIPSDDEACWMACANLAHNYKMIGVLHSDESKYYDLLAAYRQYLSGFISVSERIKNAALACLGSTAIPNAVIPCGIDLKKYTSSAKDEKLIFWIGRMEERQKRVTDIIPVCLGLRAAGIPYILKIFGNGELYKSVEQEISDNRLQNEVYLMDWQSSDEIARQLAGANILLQTSNFEGMSVAVMESLAAGCRIVSTRVSGVEDLSADKDAGDIVKLYEIGNIGEAVDCLKDYLSGVSDKASADAIRIADKYYSIASCMNKYKGFSVQISLPDIKSRTYNTLTISVYSFLISFVRYYKWKLKK